MPFGSRPLPYKERPLTTFACPLDASPRVAAPPPDPSPAAKNQRNAGGIHATMGHLKAISPTPLPPVANPCGQTICITSFGPAWQEKVQFYVSGIGRVNIFDEMRRVVHGELTRRSRTYLTTTFHCCYPFMTTIRPRYQVAAALYHDQLQHLLLSSRVLIPALDASGS